ncbi:hypothetical protein GCM10022198_22980 [Klugiella xanthotipulae]
MDEFGVVHTVQGEELRGAPVTVRDCAGLIEQQGCHVSRRLNCPSREGEHIALNQSVHTRDADCGEQSTDGCGDETYEQGDQHRQTDRWFGLGLVPYFQQG